MHSSGDPKQNPPSQSPLNDRQRDLHVRTQSSPIVIPPRSGFAPAQISTSSSSSASAAASPSMSPQSATPPHLSSSPVSASVVTFHPQRGTPPARVRAFQASLASSRASFLEFNLPPSTLQATGNLTRSQTMEIQTQASATLPLTRLTRHASLSFVFFPGDRAKPVVPNRLDRDCADERIPSAIFDNYEVAGFKVLSDSSAKRAMIEFSRRCKFSDNFDFLLEMQKVNKEEKLASTKLDFFEATYITDNDANVSAQDKKVIADELQPSNAHPSITCFSGAVKSVQDKIALALAERGEVATQTFKDLVEADRQLIGLLNSLIKENGSYPDCRKQANIIIVNNVKEELERNGWTRKLSSSIDTLANDYQEDATMKAQFEKIRTSSPTAQKSINAWKLRHCTTVFPVVEAVKVVRERRVFSADSIPRVRP